MNICNIYYSFEFWLAKQILGFIFLSSNTSAIDISQ